MADKTPIRGAYNGSSALTGLAEYATGDTVSVAFGGTGIATIGSNQLVTGNGTSAIASESNLTFDGTILKATGDLCATVKVVAPGLCIGSQYALPAADGSAGQLMCTDGSGALAFATVASTSPGGSDTYVQFNNSSAFGGSANLTWDDTTLATTAFTATGNVSLDGGTFVFNESGADKDFRVEGDSEANLFVADASTDRIGIGTATPSHLLDVEGVANVATCVVTPKLCIPTVAGFGGIDGYTLPASDGSGGQLMCTDGSGALAFASYACARGIDDIKGYINGGALKWEVASGTTYSFGWWQSSNGQWWLLGNTAEVDVFTRAQAEFYIPTGDINDVPSS